MEASTKLDKIANVVLILTCVVFSVYLAVGLRSQFTNKSLHIDYVVGDQMEELEAIDFGASPRTLLIALRSSCNVCADSMPFYRELVRHRNPELTRIVALTFDSLQDGMSFLSKHGVQVDHVVSVGQKELRISRVPTILLVDSAGKIIKTSVGKPSREHDEELLELFLS